MAVFLLKYISKYYYVIIFVLFTAVSTEAIGQDTVIKTNGEVLQGALKQELSGALKFKPEGQKKSIYLDASEIKSYYCSSVEINLNSRRAHNSQDLVFFPDLKNINSAIEYEFQNGMVQVIPCGEIKLYKYKVLGEEGIHGGRVEYVDIYMEDAEHGLYKVYGSDISAAKQQEVLALFAKGKTLLAESFAFPFKVSPKRMDELVLFCSSIVY